MKVTGNQLTPHDHINSIDELLISRYGLDIGSYSVVYNNLSDNDMVTLIYSHSATKGQIRVTVQFNDGYIVRFEGVLL